MNFFREFLMVALVHLLAVMSPGPDFVLVSRNSLIYSRKIALFSSIGLALGVLVHVTYSLIGIGFIISQSVVLFSILKYAGALYLMYIGYKCLKSKKQGGEQSMISLQSPQLNIFQALKTGFFTNVLNPKVTLFFFALFTQVIQSDTPKYIQALYGLEMSLMTFIWFACISFLLSHRRVKSRFARIHFYLEKVFGVVLIAFGVKVALSSK